MDKLTELEQRVDTLEKKIAALEVQVQKLLKPKIIGPHFKEVSDTFGWTRSAPSNP